MGAMQFMNPPSKLNQLEQLINEKFIGESDQTKMEDAAANAMIASLNDRWSYYIPAAEYAAYSERMDNAYVGVGITISLAENESGFLVETVQKDGPAAEAGMLPGDIIVAIEGQSTEGMTTTEARDLVRGKEDTTVSLTVMRQGEAITLYMTRKQVQTVVAEGTMLTETIGLITIANFDSRCAEETIGEIEALIADGAKMLIFDVRNNPGGYANELVKVLDFLLPEGELFRTQDYSGKEHVDKSDADYLDMPMAVIVNAESYSAAEFFAAALDEYDAAVVIGEQTCGKGYFQTTFQLTDGSAVGLSIGKYFTPKGVSLAGVGITPEIPVEVDEETFAAIYYGMLAPEEDPQIQAALNYMLDLEQKKNS